ncbi:MAG: phage tail protein [Dermatophilaceae bacterium]
MSDPYIGEIRLFAGNYAPAGWAFCDGSLQAISENDALFSLLGTTYGGDGSTTFALPDLRGRVPIHTGQGPGLTSRSVGQVGGAEQVTLAPAQMPTHSHPAYGADDTSVTTNPSGRVLGHPTTNTYRSPYGGPTTTMSASSVGMAGGSQPHNNVAPSLAISFIISLFGIYPSPT